MARKLLPILTLLGLALPATAAADERLSNERTLTRWAHTNLLGPIRAKPSHHARTVARLRWNTEDGLPEVYIVLRSRIDRSERKWLQIRVPGRPNGRKGWVREYQLSNLKTVRTHLTVDRGALKATLRKRGKVIWTSRIGVGAPGTPTPGGRFWIRERLRGDGAIYGPWAFGTSAYSSLSDWPGGGVIGIHGTDQPWLIGQAVSHGCIRMRNADILRLRHWAKPGTRLRIHS